ncbi:capsular biosynthesis protein, partial [Campylobacter ovis]|nr:capsular biosynthesis protein [Campylobacter ovis]
MPIGNKRLYEYQVKLFNSLNEKIVLSLPQSFALEQADKDRLKQLSVDIIFVPDNISLGESIIYCLNMLMPLNENIRILHGDTYF